MLQGSFQIPKIFSFCLFLFVSIFMKASTHELSSFVKERNHFMKKGQSKIRICIEH